MPKINPTAIFLSAACLLAGAFFLIQTIIFVQNAQTITGTVISVRQEPPTNQVFRTVTFIYNQRPHTIKIPSTRRAYGQEGQPIELLVDPNKPEHAKLNKFFAIWIIPLAFIMIGLVVPAAALGVKE